MPAACMIGSRRFSSSSRNWLISAADAGHGKRVAWMRTHAAAEAFLRNELCNGDLLLTMGAGDVDRVARELGS